MNRTATDTTRRVARTRVIAMIAGLTVLMLGYAAAVRADILQSANASIAQQTRLDTRAAAVTQAMAEAQDESYARATAALDSGNYAQAIDLFREVVAAGGTRVPAALYWIAYAQHRNGESGDALTTINELAAGYPESRWTNDARVLETEIRGAAGQGPAVESDDEDLRLYALNSLIHVDSERAVPMLERILGDESEDLELRKRAVFVLMQGGSDAAFDIVAEVARGSAHPELRSSALRHLGMFGGDRSLSIMQEIYASTDDVDTKKSILSGFMMAGATDRLWEAASGESNEELRKSAIRHLAMAGGHDQLWDLYQTETSVEIKESILRSMMMGGDSTRLLMIAQTEQDASLRRAAVRTLGMMGDHDDGEPGSLTQDLLQIYRQDADDEVREAVLNALWMRGEAASLIAMFESETDPELRRKIVSKLSMMDSEEAVEFLIRLIERQD